MAFRGDYELHTAPDAEAALVKIENDGPFAVLVSDMQMPGFSGIDLLRKTGGSAPGKVCILFAGHSNEDTAGAASTRVVYSAI